MLKPVLRFRVVLVVLLMLTLFCPGAFARGNDREDNKRDSRESDREDSRKSDRGNDRRDDREHSGGDRHYYRDGRWYKRGWFGFDIAVSALVIGAFIDSLPPRHTTVVVEGTQYYHDDRYYYRPLPDGSYVVVQAPVIVQPQSRAPETSTVNIPNSRGGYTAVRLIKSGNGYIGPQGEYYPNHPSVEQLKAMYGN